MEVIDAPVIAKTTTYGGFWVRLGALLIDGLVLAPFIYGVGYFNIIHWKSLEVLVLISLIGMMYKPLMEFKYRATLGKMAFRLIVTNSIFEPPSVNDILMRNIFHIVGTILSLLATVVIYQADGFEYIDGWLEYSAFANQFIGNQVVSWLIIIIMLIDMVVLIGDNKKCSLHDKIGKTYVIVR